MNTRVFLVVAVAVILLFKNAETPGAFLRPRTRTCGWRGGTKGTAEPALLRTTWRETPRPVRWPATGITDRLRSTARA